MSVYCLNAKNALSKSAYKMNIFHSKSIQVLIELEYKISNLRILMKEEFLKTFDIVITGDGSLHPVNYLL